MLDLLFGLLAGLIIGRWLERRRYQEELGKLRADQPVNFDDIRKDIQKTETGSTKARRKKVQ